MRGSIRMNGKKELLSSIKLNLIKQKKFEEAICSLTEFLKQNPNNAEAYCLLARAYRGLQNYDLALDNLIKAMILDPKIPSLKFLLRGIAKLFHDKFDLEKINQYAEIFPDESIFCEIRAIYFHRKKQYKKALTEYSNALVKNPYDAVLYCDRALVFKELGDYENALSDYDKALKLNPSKSAHTHIDKAILYLKKERFHDAFHDLEQFIEIASEDPKDHLDFLPFAYNNKDFDELIEICDRRLTDTHKDWCAISCRGILNMLKKNFDNAILDFTEAINIESENPKIYFCRGFAFMLLEKLNIASEDAKTAYSLKPGSALYGAFFKKFCKLS